MLIAPGVLWYHYFVVLLPLVLASWPKIGRRGRTLISFGYAALALPTAIGGLMAIAGGGLIVAALMSADDPRAKPANAPPESTPEPA